VFLFDLFLFYWRVVLFIDLSIIFRWIFLSNWRSMIWNLSVFLFKLFRLFLFNSLRRFRRFSRWIFGFWGFFWWIFWWFSRWFASGFWRLFWGISWRILFWRLFWRFRWRFWSLSEFSLFFLFHSLLHLKLLLFSFLSLSEFFLQNQKLLSA